MNDEAASGDDVEFKADYTYEIYVSGLFSAEVSFTETEGMQTLDPNPTSEPTPTEELPDNPDDPGPGWPDDPDNPGWPDDPDDPDNPGWPDDPDDPDNPGWPDDPDNPDNPDDPGPGFPDDPDDPDNPDDPGPGFPDDPDDPENPDDPDVTPTQQPSIDQGAATIILTASNNWNDGTGYQMLIDKDLTACGEIFVPGLAFWNNFGSDAPSTYYDAFEYKIPTNADGHLMTENIVCDGTVTLEIPAGYYDWVVVMPNVYEGQIFIAGDALDDTANHAWGDDYAFEPGKTYHFTICGGSDMNYDWVQLDITGEATGELTPPPTSGEVVTPAPGNDHTENGFSFEENPFALGWVAGDKDGDGHTWEWIPWGEHDGRYYEPYDGNGFMVSDSYSRVFGYLNPDNYLITPTFKAGKAFSARLREAEGGFTDTIAFYLSTDGEEWKELQKVSITYDPYKEEKWYSYVLDTSEYEGQEIQIAFRHFESPSQVGGEESGNFGGLSIQLDYVKFDGIDNGGVPGTPTPAPKPTPLPDNYGYGFSFETDPSTLGWETDTRGDGEGFQWLSDGKLGNFTFDSYDGAGLYISASQDIFSGDPLGSVDNWLISPEYLSGEDFGFYMKQFDSQFNYNDVIEVYISEDGQSWRLLSTENLNPEPDGKELGWVARYFTIMEYNQKNVRVALRHCTSPNGYVVGIDCFEHSEPMTYPAPPTTPKPTPDLGDDPDRLATITLITEDFWPDHSGYVMWLDSDANTYGTDNLSGTAWFAPYGDMTPEQVAQFEYSIPVEADGYLRSENVVCGESCTVQVPEGIYDWAIVNYAVGEGLIYKASANGNIDGAYNNFPIVRGKNYVFYVYHNLETDTDAIELEIDGEPFDPNDLPQVQGDVCEITLVAEDCYGDGSGYVMFLDSNASAYGDVFDPHAHFHEGAELPEELFGAFEYTIPTDAEPNIDSGHVLTGGRQATIRIPSGVYDWAVVNYSYKEDIFYPCNDYGTVTGTYDGFVFQAGKHYIFHVYPGTDGAYTYDCLDYTYSDMSQSDPGSEGAGWSFENNPLDDGWHMIDEDGDEKNWEWVENGFYHGMTMPVHDGSSAVASAAWDIVAQEDLNPVNWLISPHFTSGDWVKFWVAEGGPDYPDTLKVYVSVDGGSWIEEMNFKVEHSDYRQYTLDTSDYNGHDIQVAFVNDNDGGEGYILALDAVTYDDPNFVPPGTDDPNPPTTPDGDHLIFDFEDPNEKWWVIDADGDGEKWGIAELADFAYSGTHFGFSASLIVETMESLDPDNWLVSDPFLGGSAISFQLRTTSPRGGDPVGIYITTDDGATYSDELACYVGTTDWVEYVIDTSAYAGQMINIAFRHYNTTGDASAAVDYIVVSYDNVTPPSESPSPTPEITPTQTPEETPVVTPTAVPTENPDDPTDPTDPADPGVTEQPGETEQPGGSTAPSTGAISLIGLGIAAALAGTGMVLFGKRKREDD